jgi:hypothetical protein
MTGAGRKLLASHFSEQVAHEVDDRRHRRAGLAGSDFKASTRTKAGSEGSQAYARGKDQR